MTEQDSGGVPVPFRFMDCSLLTVSTGIRAQSLRELRAAVSTIPTSSIYYHFWGRMLRPHIAESEYNNDFATWADSGLGDVELAEELSSVNAADCKDMEEVREILEDILDAHLDRDDFMSWKKSDRDFFFIDCTKLMFDTGREVSSLDDFPKEVKTSSLQSFFHHYIDGRRRSEEGKDDFTLWLEQFGDETKKLRSALQSVDSYLFSLGELKSQVVAILERFARSRRRDDDRHA
ncbi:MAG: hypothetical protein GX181_04000 [Synergistaceae bacterium]|nr:DUF5752 family protein [Synergistota bacterium]NLM71111.1 hypothetical protein [Synergistaceae bacterium]